MKNNKSTIPLKILSVFIAFFMWYYIMSIGDPVTTKLITGIKVHTINDNAIRDEGKTFIVKNDSDVINIRVTDRRSLIDKLTADDFIATADLAKWNDTGNIPIVVTCSDNKISPSNFVQSSYAMQIKVDNLVSKTMPIRINAVGKPASGLVIGKMTASPESVTLSGPESDIDDIQSIQTFVNVTGRRDDFDEVTLIQLFDKSGKEIVNNNISFESQSDDEKGKINVKVRFLHATKLNIKVILEGKLDEGLMLGDVVCDPEAVAIKGDDNFIKKFNEIVVNDPALDITNKRTSFTKTVDIRKFIPEGLELYGDDDKVTITVNINKLSSKEYEIPFSNVRLFNIPKGYRAEIVGSGVLDILLYGKNDILNLINYANLNPSVDLSECNEARTYELPLNLELPESIENSSFNHVYVRLERIKDDNDENRQNDEIKKSDDVNKHEKGEEKDNTTGSSSEVNN